MIKIINGGISVDDRGSVRFVNDFNFDGVKRFYQVENHDINYIRAWHGHKKEGKYVYVTSGTILLGIVNMESLEVKTHVVSAKSPKIIFIPPVNYNGFQTLEKNTTVLFFSTSSLEESLDDDIRQDWDKWNIWEKKYR